MNCGRSRLRDWCQRSPSVVKIDHPRKSFHSCYAISTRAPKPTLPFPSLKDKSMQQKKKTTPHLLKLLPLPIIPKLRRQNRLHILLIRGKHHPPAQHLGLDRPPPLHLGKHPPPELMVAVVAEVPEGLDDDAEVEGRVGAFGGGVGAERGDAAFVLHRAAEDGEGVCCAGQEEGGVGDEGEVGGEGAERCEEEGVEEGGRPDAVEEGGEHFARPCCGGGFEVAVGLLPRLLNRRPALQHPDTVGTVDVRKQSNDPMQTREVQPPTFMQDANTGWVSRRQLDGLQARIDGCCRARIVKAKGGVVPTPAGCELDRWPSERANQAPERGTQRRSESPASEGAEHN